MNDTVTVSYFIENITPKDDDNDKRNDLFVEIDDDEEYIPMTNQEIDAMFE